MRILIIGGSGYIGQHIVNELIDNNVEVVVMDRYFQSSSNNNFIIDKYYETKILMTGSSDGYLKRIKA